MVIKFLLETSEFLQERKRVIEAKHREKKIEISENIKLIEKLKAEDDMKFDPLSPKKPNADNHYKILQLEDKQKILFDNCEELAVREQELTMRLLELDSVLKIAKDYEEEEKIQINGLLEKNDFYKLKMLEIQEKERQRIARELHDSSVQNMVSMVHKVELCSKLIDIDPIRCKLELVAMSKNMKDIIEEMRKMIYDLRPMSFDDIGFEVTLERDLASIQNMGVNIKYTVEGEKKQINPVISLTLLRVIKEACNNAVKHAEPTIITVKIRYENDKIYVNIIDDGKGFVVPVESQQNIRNDYSGFGLLTMRERVLLLSGKLQIESEIGVGTKVIIEVPIKEEKENVSY